MREIAPLYRIGSEVEGKLPISEKVNRERERIENAMRKAMRRAERK
ncbi:MAG: hypothetical protein ACP5GD_03985 [Candidatus Micrarchaeia archaeon]|jgi:hypothetical protein